MTETLDFAMLFIALRASSGDLADVVIGVPTGPSQLPWGSLRLRLVAAEDGCIHA